MVGPTPEELQRRGLEVLTAEGGVAEHRRERAAVDAWVVAHGLATLVLIGAPALPRGDSLGPALEATLDLPIDGLKGGSD